MKLSYVYVSVPELQPALAFYRDELGLDEAWREGEGTVAFELPGSPIQLMLDVPPDDHARWSSGPFYEVDDVERFVGEHPQLTWVGESIDVPGGRSASLSDPAGNIIHIFDQTAPQQD
ncbi:MAG TPA: VOC family protein [Ilumatobacteraceae bacterium]|nr:VOC family protein [Ilumatobacteraceae bacterium]